MSLPDEARRYRQETKRNPVVTWSEIWTDKPENDFVEQITLEQARGRLPWLDDLISALTIQGGVDTFKFSLAIDGVRTEIQFHDWRPE